MSIHVNNLSSGETLTYSLALLIGEVTPPLTQSSITVLHGEQRDTQPLSWPVYNGAFKALVLLHPGDNVIKLKFFDEIQDFLLRYEVPKFTRFVRPVYLVAASHDGYFQGPSGEDCSPESALRRISLGAKLLQTFTAEKLFEHGLGRRTFLLETDLYPGNPPCYIFRSKLKVEDAYKMSGGDLWMYFARELMSSKIFTQKDNCKWYTFLSFTKYCPPEGIVPKSHSDVLKNTKGHAALGGGGLALFGTGNLHTWSEHLEDVVTRFTDSRKIDRTQFMDDSAYRQTHWANFSTGLGASLHELGHTFDLAHTKTGVMARGFDDLYRVFTVQPQISSQCSSRDSSHLSSPVPYSPKDSPVHRTRHFFGASSGSSSVSASAKPGPQSSPHHRLSPIPPSSAVLSTLPAVIQIETAFKRLRTETRQTFTVENYDGSMTKRSVMKHKDGSETLTEITTYKNGEMIAREVISNVTSGKTRTTLSMTTSSDELSDLLSSTKTSSINSIEASTSTPPSTTAPHPKQDTSSMPAGTGVPPQEWHQSVHISKDQCMPQSQNLSASFEAALLACGRPKRLDQSKSLSHVASDNVTSTTATTTTTRDLSVTVNGLPEEPDDQPLCRKVQRNVTHGSSQGQAVKLNKLLTVGGVPATSGSEHLQMTTGLPMMAFQEVQYKEGGAHWYRSSAIMLTYHKWFNPPNLVSTGGNPTLEGNVILAPCGLRLIELRSLHDSVVLHHWEFLHIHPPTQFTLKHSEIIQLSQNAEGITIVAEDNSGNIFKRKIQIDTLKESVVKRGVSCRKSVT